jgi:hypothetical protein
MYRFLINICDEQEVRNQGLFMLHQFDIMIVLYCFGFTSQQHSIMATSQPKLVEEDPRHPFEHYCRHRQGKNKIKENQMVHL